ncbi:MAG: hypothetical protein QM662_16580, partial [Gordonia sp. (in: high G+C Gram-positive bacteria)]
MTIDTREFDAAADDLYGRDPGEFVARRTELARAARADGNRDLATEITALRRPTQVAWLLNQWVRRHPDGVDELTAIGAELREAQRRAAGDRLRDLASRRKRVIADAVVGVGTLAAELGVGLSGSAEHQLISTVRAALADPDVAQTLRRGRLVAAAEYSGFGPAAMAAVGDPG